MKVIQKVFTIGTSLEAWDSLQTRHFIRSGICFVFIIFWSLEYVCHKWRQWSVLSVTLQWFGEWRQTVWCWTWRMLGQIEWEDWSIGWSIGARRDIVDSEIVWRQSWTAGLGWLESWRWAASLAQMSPSDVRTGLEFFTIIPDVVFHRVLRHQWRNPTKTRV